MINVLPSAAANDAANGTLVHAVLPGKCRTDHAERRRLANTSDLGLCELGATVPAPGMTDVSEPALGHTVMNVVGVRAKEEVSRVAARRVVAAMQNIAGRCTVSEFPGEAMDFCRLVSIGVEPDADLAVSKGVSRALPLPASSGCHGAVRLDALKRPRSRYRSLRHVTDYITVTAYYGGGAG